MAISINHTSAGLLGKTRETSPVEKKDWFSFALTRPIKPVEVLFFTSQLSLMLEIGTPLKAALQTIRDQTQNPSFQELIQDLLQDIEAGRQLSDALRRHPKVFNKIYASMIKAGETGGFVQEILDRLVEIQEKRQALKTQLRSALTYPLVLCLVAFVVIVFVLVFVLPKFTGFFAGKEAVLPLTTRALMTLSASLQSYWWMYLMAAAGLMAGLKLARQSPKGQELIDWVAVSGPLISRLVNKVYTCQILRILGTLMESQVPMLEALEVTRATVVNRHFMAFIDRIIDHVRQGGKFSQPFASYPYTLESVKRMVATGEETGNLPKVMIRLAEFYDAEVERELKNVATLIEPVALIVMGAVVGLIVSSVVLPLFKLAAVMH